MSAQEQRATEELVRGQQARTLEDLPGELLALDPPEAIAESNEISQAADRRDSTYRRLLGASDLIAAVLALVATATFTHTSQVYWAMFVAVLFVVPIGKLAGLYDRDAHVLNHTTIEEVPKIFTLAMMTTVIAFFARDLAVIGSPGLGTKQLVFLIAVMTVFLIVGRVIARFAARLVSPTERLLVVGSSVDCDHLTRKIVLSPQIRAEIVGRVPITTTDLTVGQAKVLGEIDDLPVLLSFYEIDRIVVVPGNRNPDEVSEVVRGVKSLGVKISLLPRLFDAIGFAVESDDVGGEQLLGVRDYRMTASSTVLKRATDVVGASLLLLLASPVMVLAAIAITLDSRGPVFFRQIRIGRLGEDFAIFKFRTMREGADSEKSELAHLNETDGLFKIEDDPRITRVGKLLRATSTDELPQLFNVLRGDMSLVGPRPLVPREDVAVTGWYRRRSSITPGITGAWQLHGPVSMPLDEMMRTDYLYVANWSWWSDAKIMLRTVRHVLARRGV
ncbi:MAG: exopolysaccharide biosynthesis polyprenyl glycosylphosphotransferase [Solirubrobacterales bacterium]|nr:exopolysaccharide biosynthesis polyprenyl glycosylphosphotransferase [Solirubrobacterales bacterium]